MNEPDVVFVLYGGTSPDGRGTGVYIGFTIDPEKALSYYREHIQDNSYSIGYVLVLEEESKYIVRTDHDIEYINKHIK